MPALLVAALKPAITVGYYPLELSSRRFLIQLGTAVAHAASLGIMLAAVDAHISDEGSDDDNHRRFTLLGS
jgi:hypothetical protein